MNQRIWHPMLMAATIAVTVGCAKDAVSVGDSSRVLLEIEVVNYAWVPTYFGFVLDAEGNIYRYDRQGQHWEQQSSYTPTQLSEKFGPVWELVATREANEVAFVEGKIAPAAGGSLSSPKSECADAGALTYRAYKYSPAIARYTTVLLRTEGDSAQQNVSQAAQELIAYIRSLGLLQELLGCDP